MAMKILIVSDSHGNNRNLIQVVKNMSGTMDMMIHLGDMECSPDRIRELVDCPVELVKGNCDYGNELQGAKLIQIGGQMPLQRRLPKFGFTNLKRVEFKAINLSTLEELAAKKSLTEVTVDTLIAAGFISSNDKVKILGNGTISKALAVKAHAFSKSAEAAITAAGGSVEKL